MKQLIFITALSLCASFTQASIDTTGLIGYWPFDGNAKDQTSNGNDGVVTDATLTADRNGKANSAYYFDGTGDYINLGRDASLKPTSMTVSAWIRLDDTTSHHNIIGCRNSNDGEWGMDMYHHKDFGIITSMGAGNSNRAIGHHTLTNLTSTDWHMITFVYDGKNNPHRFATYIDCEFLGYENRTGSSGGLQGSDRIAYTNKNDWIIGAHSQYFSDAVNQGHYFFKGAIDDVVIYNRALSQKEIENLGGKTSSIADLTPSPLIFFPNPSTGLLYVENSDERYAAICIYNSVGVLVKEQNFVAGRVEIDMTNYTKGMYIAVITRSSGAIVESKKIIIE